MALLQHLTSGRQQRVTSHLRVGRAPDAGLRITTSYISHEHATLRWNGDGWEVKDLGSRNGTFVDGERIEAGRSARVDVGSRIAFGDIDECWEVIEADAPGVIAEPIAGGEAALGHEGLLVLPDPEHPELSVFRANDGTWKVETVEGDVCAVEDQAIVDAGGREWRLLLPSVIEGTPAFEVTPTLDAISMKLKVSRDEETVQIDILHRGRVIALEPMWHGYVLVTLARERERMRQLPIEERGWVDRDRLLKMLRMDANNLNVAIHKAREQLLDAGVLGAAGIVEVRRKQRRLGIERFEVIRL